MTYTYTQLSCYVGMSWRSSGTDDVPQCNRQAGGERIHVVVTHNFLMGYSRFSMRKMEVMEISSHSGNV